MGDDDRIKEVVLNLLTNAIKFSDAGTISITGEVGSKEVTIRVSDEGKGIPAANQNRLFRKFQQASNNILTRDTTRSTGLGLYISKLIMEGMNGKIYLERSEENKGSTFAISLPIAGTGEGK